VMWKNRSSDVPPVALGLGGAHMSNAICAPFTLV
jgi:hypothetical protein